MAITRPLFKASEVTFMNADNEHLNVYPADLGEEFISLSWGSEATTMIPVAIGSQPSLNIYAQATITINLLKTSEKYLKWLDRMNNNSLIGDAEFEDDAQNVYTIKQLCILKAGDIQADGKTATVQFTCMGDYYYNKAVYTSLGVL